jgi:hypothetical protein
VTTTVRGARVTVMAGACVIGGATTAGTGSADGVGAGTVLDDVEVTVAAAGAVDADLDPTSSANEPTTPNPAKARTVANPLMSQPTVDVAFGSMPREPATRWVGEASVNGLGSSCGRMMVGGAG